LIDQILLAEALADTRKEFADVVVISLSCSEKGFTGKGKCSIGFGMICLSTKLTGRRQPLLLSQPTIGVPVQQLVSWLTLPLH